MKVEKYKGSYRAVYDENGSLICVCVYKKGAMHAAQFIQALMQRKEVISNV